MGLILFSIISGTAVAIRLMRITTSTADSTVTKSKEIIVISPTLDPVMAVNDFIIILFATSIKITDPTIVNNDIDSERRIFCATKIFAMSKLRPPIAFITPIW